MKLVYEYKLLGTKSKNILAWISSYIKSVNSSTAGIRKKIKKTHLRFPSKTNAKISP